jgi:hypothetical protein
MIARVREGALAADHREGLLGDLELLVGGHDQHGHGGRRPPRWSGGGRSGPVALGAEGDARPSRPWQPLARTPSLFSPIPAVNTSASQPAQGGRVNPPNRYGFCRGSSAALPRQNAAARLVGERACAGVAVEPHDVHEFRRAARRLRQGNSLRS